jgi:hypothetical protein
MYRLNDMDNEHGFEHISTAIPLITNKMKIEKKQKIYKSIPLFECVKKDVKEKTRYN